MNSKVELKMPAALGRIAGRALEDYDFGQCVRLAETSESWKCSPTGNEWTITARVERWSEDGNDARNPPLHSTDLRFTVRFNPDDGSLAQAIAEDGNGKVWGSLPNGKLPDSLFVDPLDLHDRLDELESKTTLTDNERAELARLVAQAEDTALPDSADGKLTGRRIEAKFQPESWTDGAPLDTPPVAVGGARTIDVTEKVLSLPLGDIQALADDTESANDLVDATALGHQGPHRVEVTQQVALFFGVDRVSDIDQAQLDAARAASGLDRKLDACAGRLEVEEFLAADGAFSHYSVITVGSDGRMADVATGFTHDTREAAESELADLRDELANADAVFQLYTKSGKRIVGVLQRIPASALVSGWKMSQETQRLEEIRTGEIDIWKQLQADEVDGSSGVMYVVDEAGEPHLYTDCVLRSGQSSTLSEKP